MSKTPLYITTPIYYVNDQPHLGHAYTTVAADVVARWHRMHHKNVFFLTGTDEHGAKVAESAEKAGMEPKAFADQNSASFQEAFKRLNVSFDRFIRTTDEDHVRQVKSFIQKLQDAGAIYEGEYEGLYCTGCEMFLTEKELVDGKCPIHKKEPVHVKEKNYFFALSKYLAEVEQLIQNDTIQIIPAERKTEALGLIKQGLEDFSISREKVKWGISFPSDPSQTVYVWVEALQNYISAIGYSDNRKQFETFWPTVTHLMAKDILKFHAIYWPALLLAAGEQVPKRLVVHGFFTLDGQKMSKSIGNVIHPNTLVDEFGSDATRYLLLSQFPFGSDGDIQADRFVEKYNASLANGLGNLASRVLTMVHKYFGGEVPVFPESQPHTVLPAAATETWKSVASDIDAFAIESAIRSIWSFITEADTVVDREKPWLLAKDQPERLAAVLSDLLETLNHLTWLIAPLLPTTASALATALGIDLSKGIDSLQPLPAGRALQLLNPLFPRK